MILFLDIDGVILPWQKPEDNPPELVQLYNEPKKYIEWAVSKTPEEPVKLINRLYKKYKFQIVVHSSWLRVFEDEITFRYLDTFFDPAMFHKEKTAGQCGTKEDSIKHWMRTNLPANVINPVENFCLIIDDDEILVNNTLLIRPNRWIGLQEKDLIGHLWTSDE